MPLHDFFQTFTSGELSPLLESRTGIEKYKGGLKTCQNFIVSPQGPLMKRAGTNYIANATTSVGAARLIGFNFADDTYGVFEITAGGNILVYKSSSTTSGPISTTYLTDSEVMTAQYAQINNLVFFTHPDQPLLCISNTSGTFASVAVGLGASGNYPPLLDENITETTIYPSATSGSVTLTASADVFTSGNIGGFFEIAQARTSGFAEVILGDDAVRASLKLTISGQPSDGHTLAFNGRTYTFKTGGRTAKDEVAVKSGAGYTADDTVTQLINAVNAGGGGADPHKEVELEILGGVKAADWIGNTTGTAIASGDKVTVGKITYTFTNVAVSVSTLPYYVHIGTNLTEGLTNLAAAINADPDNSGYAKSTSGGTTEANPLVEALDVVTTSGSGKKLNLRARNEGAGGNEIPLSTTSAVISPNAALFTGGLTYINVLALYAGTAANSYAVAKGSTYTWIALPAAGTSENMAGGTEETSDGTALTVIGKYEVRTTGKWTGTLKLQERPVGGSTWSDIRAWTGTNGDSNVSFASEQTIRREMRLTFTGHGEAIDRQYPRAIIEPADAFHRALYLITAVASATSATATTLAAPLASGAGAASKYWSESAWSTRRGYPRAICFHQNRLWLASSKYEPNKLWASQLGDFLNFRYSSSDDGALAFQIASTDLQRIEWLASANGLVIGTSKSEWTAREADGQTAITPTNPPVFTRVSNFGSEPIQPVTVGESVIFVEKYGRRVRRLFYDDATRGYVASNLTVLAEHITQGGITGLAVQNRPETVIWCRVTESTTGYHSFATLTMEPDQNVFAWARHSSTGTDYDGVTVVSGPTGEEVWFMGKCGSGSVRTLMRADIPTLNRTALATAAIHTDCTVSKTGAAFTTIDLPAGLNGGQLTIKYGNGTVEYSSYASTLTITSTTSVQVGRAILSSATTMRLDYALQDGSTQGRAIRIPSIVVRVLKSAGGQVMVGPYNQDNLETLYNLTGSTATGDVEHIPKCSWENDARVTIAQSKPWPFTLTGLICRVDIGSDAAHKQLVGDS